MLGRLVGPIASWAFRKFGGRRYELRLKVRGVLIEGSRQIDPERYVRSKQIRETLHDLASWVDLLPGRDKVRVLAATAALETLQGGPPSAYEDQVAKDAWEAACAAARIPVSEAVDYLNRRLRV